MRNSSNPASSGRNLVIAAVPLLFVAVTFLFWYQTWFGRRLDEGEMAQYLNDVSVPHKTQHALSQVAERIARGDATARRWYPEVVRLAANRQPGLRLMAAWVMGQDANSAEFHRALLALLADSDPMVRWNAALALVRFGDATGRPELRQMLRPYALKAPQAGTIAFRLQESDRVRRDGVVARIGTPRGGSAEVRSPLAGELERRLAGNGAPVRAGDEVAVISPGEEQVFQALRALCLVGGSDDLEDVERYARGVPGTSARVREQAASTAQAIRKRAVTSDKISGQPVVDGQQLKTGQRIFILQVSTALQI